MKEQSEFSEFIVIGVFALMLFSSIYLVIFDIPGELIVKYVSSITSGNIVLLVVLSYSIGVLTSRTLQMLDYEFFKSLIGNFFIKKVFSKSDIKYIENFNREEWVKNEILVQQYGSESVVNRIGYQHSLMRIFKAATILLPITAIFASIWVNNNFGLGNSAFFTTSLLLCAFLSFKSHRNVKKSEIWLVSEVSRILEEKNK